MRYWLDTEFMEAGFHQPIIPLSVAVVCEDGRELYLESIEGLMLAPNKANDFVRANVLPHLMVPFLTEGRIQMDNVWLGKERAKELGYAHGWVSRKNTPLRNRQEIKDELLAFFNPDLVGGSRPEIWAYYADYDWVVLCGFFGTMVDLPKGFPMYCLDIKQLRRA